jgi:hypothetical protein
MVKITTWSFQYNDTFRQDMLSMTPIMHIQHRTKQNIMCGYLYLCNWMNTVRPNFVIWVRSVLYGVHTAYKTIYQYTLPTKLYTSTNCLQNFVTVHIAYKKTLHLCFVLYLIRTKKSFLYRSSSTYAPA